MRLIHLILMLIPATAVAPFAAVAAESSPTPDELAGLVRKWSSKDDAIESFEIAGQLANAFTFHVIQLQTGETASSFSSIHDAMPVMATVNGRAIGWDVMRQQAFLISNLLTAFELKIADSGTPSLHLNGLFKPQHALKDMELLLDLPGVLDYAPKNRTVESLGDRRYKLTGTTQRGGTVTMWFNLERRQPVERIQASTKDGEVVWEVSRLRVNEPVKVELPPLPTKEQLGEHFEVIELEARESAARQIEAVMQRLRRTYLVRAALNEEATATVRSGLRDILEKSERRTIDWKALAERNATDARIIRELVKLPDVGKDAE